MVWKAQCRDTTKGCLRLQRCGVESLKSCGKAKTGLFSLVLPHSSMCFSMFYLESVTCPQWKTMGVTQKRMNVCSCPTRIYQGHSTSFEMLDWIIYGWVSLTLKHSISHKGYTRDLNTKHHSSKKKHFKAKGNETKSPKKRQRFPLPKNEERQPTKPPPNKPNPSTQPTGPRNWSRARIRFSVMTF